MAGRGAVEAPHHRRRPRRPRSRPRRAARRRMPALGIVNDVLLDGMKVVGELFGSGEMQLPFVLQSAETMKTAVAYLEPHMEKVEGDVGKGTIVLGTVKGDVHDIGKNLVDIILTNNGYTVHNLGIKVPVHDLIEKAVEVKADAIGMSGLLVKSTIIMRENLQELNERGLATDPGAARRRRADPQLRRGRPAAGLRRAGLLRQGRVRGPAHDGHARHRRRGPGPSTRSSAARSAGASCRRARAERVEEAGRGAGTFGGRRSTCRCSRRRSSGRASRRASRSTTSPAYVNETALFRNQWQFRPDKTSAENDEQFKERIRPVLREQLDRAKAEGLLVPAVAWGYFAVNAEGDDLVVWKDDDRTPGVAAVQLPAPAQGAVPLHRRLLPARGVGRGRLRRVPRLHDGPARVANGNGSCSRRTSTRTTCCCTASRSR